MEGLTLIGAATLFLTMFVLALVPSTSVLIVLTRTVQGGVTQGLAAIAGIALVDISFALIALFGLAFIAERSADAFTIIRILAAAYLIWMGVQMLRSTGTSSAAVPTGTDDASLLSGFLAGFLFTLSDQKAILFYFGLLPAFIDPAAYSQSDVFGLVMIIIAAVGGAKLVYVLAAERMRRSLDTDGHRQKLSQLAGVIMLMVGASLILLTLR